MCALLCAHLLAQCGLDVKCIEPCQTSGCFSKAANVTHQWEAPHGLAKLTTSSTSTAAFTRLAASHAHAGPAHATVGRLLCGLLLHWAPEVRAGAGAAAQRVTASEPRLLVGLLEALRGCMDEPSGVAAVVVVRPKG